MTGMRSGVRWREDVGWEVRCDDCAKHGSTGIYWPLTDEFWIKSSMRRCRACHLAKKRRRDYQYYWSDPEYRAKKAAEAKAYRAESGDVIRIKRREKRHLDALQSRVRYWENPQAERQKSREYYWRNRDRILEKRRATYRKNDEEAA